MDDPKQLLDDCSSTLGHLSVLLSRGDSPMIAAREACKLATISIQLAYVEIAEARAKEAKK